MTGHNHLAVGIAFALGVIRLREPTTPPRQMQRVAEMERRARAESKRMRRRARNLKQEATTR